MTAAPHRPPPDPALISFVIPVYNEWQSLAELHDQITAATAPLGRPVEVIFVDDGSRDRSWEVIAELAAKNPSVRGVRFRRNFGKADALQAGFDRARGGTVFTLDADLQDDPKEIPRFLDALDAGADLVSGWKQKRYDPWHKVLPSRVFNGMVSRLTGVSLHDHNCGFKAYRAEVPRTVRLYGELHRFVPALAGAKGWRVAEVVVHHRARQYGHSKFGARRFLKGFLDLLHVRFTTEFGRRPLHLLGTWALMLVAAGALPLASVALAALVADVHLLAWVLAGLLAATCTVLGGQCFLAGLLAELLVARTPHESPADGVAGEIGGAA